MAAALRDREETEGRSEGDDVPGDVTDEADVAAVVGLSPWLDATLDEEAVDDLEPSDPMLAETGLRAAGRWWAGRRHPADPLVSPIHADLRGLPPIHVYIGERDILRPAVEKLVERAGRDDVSLHVHEYPAMFHVWMTRAIPEGCRTRRDLVALLRDHIRGR
jgi:acetyl esterase/lipase